MKMLSNILVAMIGQVKAKIKLREFLKLREVLITFFLIFIVIKLKFFKI